MKKMKKNTEQPVLEARNISLSFDGNTLFRNFSLSVSAGEKVIIAGPSGSGKTTLMKCFMGFVRPDSGDLRINGKRIDECSVWKFRTLMGYV